MYRPDIVTMGDIARVHGREKPDVTAFICDDRTTSYGEFDSRANRVANGLLAEGLGHQDRIAYIGKNSDHYFEMLMGGAKAGLVMVAVNWRLAPPEIAYILKDAKARVLFAGPEFAGLVDQIRDELPDLKRIILIDDYPAWRDAQDGTDPACVVSEADVAVQLYTSGTTGHPKGAQITHGNLNALRKESDEQPDWNRWSDADVSLVAMPNFHIGGTGWGLSGLYPGALNVVMPEFDPSLVLDFIQRYRISKIFLVPAAMQIIVRDPRARETDFSCMSHILYGASPIPLDLLRECMEVFGCGFAQMYGMTETTGTVCVLPPEDHDPNGNPKMRSAGKPLPGVAIEIRDEDGKALPPGEVGEICIKGGSNMPGYWNLPEATEKTIGTDGWLRSGDAGYVDEDGYVYIHDRVKDMIISGGENIYPAEVESAIYGHPAIADVAVIGVPDDKWGEAVKACVVLKEGQSATPEDIITFTRERIAGFKCPKSIDFIEALPRNPSGKILRRELRAPYWVGKDRAVN